jgi:hypothetical protein
VIRKALLSFLVVLALAGHSVCAGYLPEGRTILVTRGDRIWRFEEDESLGWPVAFPFLDPFEDTIQSLELGPDGYLYVATYKQILRCTLDGAERTVVMDAPTLFPFDICFDPTGNLFFSTYGSGGTRDTPPLGVFMIEGAVPGLEPRMILDPGNFRPILLKFPQYNVNLIPPPFLGYVTDPLEELLFTGTEDALLASSSPPGYGTHALVISNDALRTPSHDFALTPAGSLLVNDWCGGAIEEFAIDGTHVRTFAERRWPRRIAVDSEGLVYITCQVFSSYQEYPKRGSLVIYAADGQVIFETSESGIYEVLVIED